MELFAYHQQDYNGFVLFFNDNGTIRRANVENIHGLKDLFNSDSVRRVHSDNIQYVQSLLDKPNTAKGSKITTEEFLLRAVRVSDFMPNKDIEDLVML